MHLRTTIDGIEVTEHERGGGGGHLSLILGLVFCAVAVVIAVVVAVIVLLVHRKKKQTGICARVLFRLHEIVLTLHLLL